MRGQQRVAADLVNEARRRAGMTQAELARRADQPRSVINAYERAQRDPRAAALAEVVAAAGCRLALRTAPRLPHDERAAILSQVLDLAESLPTKRPGRLAYPPFRAAVDP